ncbi:MAG: hypothetical protein EOO12_06205 [Chitinophagaceae bacterium]|nr:MAG: hypothetical protein EOO12_06205 [Chitinophagaceae bacterium]
MHPRPHRARFRFEGRLADLSGAPAIDYAFAGGPALKDAVEALGVPHVEVGALRVNGAPSTLSNALQPGDEVQVSPDETPWPEPRFILDVHLGSLARALRLLGFDSWYRNDYSDPQIVALAAAEDRAALTRDLGLLKHKALGRGYWLRSQHTEDQVREVLHRYGLHAFIRPFRRCLACNELISPVAEADVLESIPSSVRGYQQEYFRCSGCGRVYWKGTHYKRMLDFIARITS